MIKTIRLIFFILGLLLFYSCQKNPVIHSIHMDVIENRQDTIVLTNYTDFDWDRALFFNDYLTCAYHEKEFIEKTYDFRLNELSFSKYEFASPIVFIKDGRIVHVEVNGEETFPDDEKRWKMETIRFFYPPGKTPVIQEVKRENCIFKASLPNGYQMHHSVMLESIP
ncbi:MAG: hypothetical protein IK011_05850 [Bacteroidaceae bacterium]|nr:hypothetical protein [Bacteroidaceae bacterium]